MERNVNQSVRSLSQQFTSVGKQLTGVGRTMSLGLTLPIVGGFYAATKAAFKFGDAMTNIRALVGATDAQMRMFESGVLRMAQTLPQGPQDLAEALYFVTSSGFQGAAAMRVLEASGRAAAAGLGETLTVANAVTSAVNAYGQSALSAQRATDVLLATVREGKADPDELTGAIGRVVAPAQTLGVEFHEVGGALAALSLVMPSASEAATGLRGILMSILKPTKMAKDALNQMGISTDQLRTHLRHGLMPTLEFLDAAFGKNVEAVGAVFGNVRALNAFMILTGANIEKTRKIMTALANSTGDTARAFREASQNPMFQFRVSMSQIQTVLIQVGQVLIPFVTAFVTKMADLVIAFGRAPTPIRNTALALAAMLAAAGPVLMIVGRLTSATGFLMTPMGRVVAGLAMLTAGLGYAYSHSAAFRTIVAQLGRVLQAMLPALAKVAEILGPILGNSVVAGALSIGLMIAGVRTLAVGLLDLYLKLQMVTAGEGQMAAASQFATGSIEAQTVAALQSSSALTGTAASAGRLGLALNALKFAGPIAATLAFVAALRTANKTVDEASTAELARPFSKSQLAQGFLMSNPAGQGLAMINLFQKWRNPAGDAADATEALTDTLDPLNDSTAAVSDALDAATDKVKLWGKQLRNGDISLAGYRERMDRLNESANQFKEGGISVGEFNKQLDGTATASNKAQAAEKQLNTLREISKRNLDEYAKSLREQARATTGLDIAVRPVNDHIAELDQRIQRLTSTSVKFAGMGPKAFGKWQDEVAQAMGDVSDVFAEVADKANLTAQEIVDAFQKRTEQMRNLAANMRRSFELGLSPGALREIATLPPEQAAAIFGALVEGGRGAVGELNKSFRGYLKSTSGVLTETGNIYSGYINRVLQGRDRERQATEKTRTSLFRLRKQITEQSSDLSRAEVIAGRYAARLGNMDDASRHEIRTMRSLATALVTARGKVSDTLREHVNAAIAAGNYGRAVDLMKGALERAGASAEGSKDKTRAFHDALKQLPATIRTEVTADVGKARNTIDGFLSGLSNRDVTVSVGAVVKTQSQKVMHSGGWVMGRGYSPRDVPTVLQAGEFVVNRQQATRHNALLEQMNAGRISDFHRGGMVGGVRGFVANPKVTVDYSKVGGAIREAEKKARGPQFGGGSIVALLRWIQSLGYLVSEHPLFGGVSPVHTPGSYHYRGRAGDINFLPAALEPAALDRLYGMLSKIPGIVELLWRVPGHFDHLHVAMQNGGVTRADVRAQLHRNEAVVPLDNAYAMRAMRANLGSDGLSAADLRSALRDFVDDVAGAIEDRPAVLELDGEKIADHQKRRRVEKRRAGAFG